MTGQEAFLFTAALTAGLTVLVVPLVALIQRAEFVGLATSDWRRATVNAGLGLLAGVALIAAIGLALPGQPLLDDAGEATDPAVISAISGGLGLVLLTTTAFNITLYRAAGRLDQRQAKWSALMVAAIYVIVVAGFAWAVME